MSAFLCSEDHLNLLVNAGPNPDAKRFKMLLDENLRSLRACYGDEWPEAKTYRFELLDPNEIVWRANGDRTLSYRDIATQIVKACDSYDYQACETDDYKETEAAKYIAMIRDHWERVGEGKGRRYDQLRWAI